MCAAFLYCSVKWKNIHTVRSRELNVGMLSDLSDVESGVAVSVIVLTVRPARETLIFNLTS